MPDVATVLDEFEASGNHQAVGEHRGFVCATVVIGVLENQDFVIRLLAWLNLRIDRAANDPESAARIEANLNWLHHAVGLGSEQVHFKAFRYLEGIEFSSRIVRFGSGNSKFQDPKSKEAPNSKSEQLSQHANQLAGLLDSGSLDFEVRSFHRAPPRIPVANCSISTSFARISGLYFSISAGNQRTFGSRWSRLLGCVVRSPPRKAQF